MDRRHIVKTTLAAGAGLLAAGMTEAAPGNAPPKIVYHLSDIDKVGFVLGNIRNHIDGMGGPDKVTIALVVHGPPLMSFRADTNNSAVKANVGYLVKANVQFFACVHTMEGMKLRLADLLPGFSVADKGGVVKIAQLQSEGWLYIRP